MIQCLSKKLQWIRNTVHDKQIFLVVHESTLFGIKYLNVLVGSLEKPYVRYLYSCQRLPCAPNSSSVAQAVDDAVRSLGVSRNTFCFLLYDAVKYMVAAGAILKSLHPKQFHVTCVAHI